MVNISIRAKDDGEVEPVLKITNKNLSTTHLGILGFYLKTGIAYELFVNKMQEKLPPEVYEEILAVVEEYDIMYQNIVSAQNILEDAKNPVVHPEQTQGLR